MTRNFALLLYFALNRFLCCAGSKIMTFLGETHYCCCRTFCARSAHVLRFSLHHRHIHIGEDVAAASLLRRLWRQSFQHLLRSNDIRRAIFTCTLGSYMMYLRGRAFYCFAGCPMRRAAITLASRQIRRLRRKLRRHGRHLFGWQFGKDRRFVAKEARTRKNCFGDQSAPTNGNEPQ